MKCMMEVIQKQCSLGGGEGKVLRMIGDREEEDRQREDEKKFHSPYSTSRPNAYSSTTCFYISP